MKKIKLLIPAFSIGAMSIGMVPVLTSCTEKEVENIQVFLNNSTKYVGDTLNESDVVVKVIYKDGSYKEIQNGSNGYEMIGKKGSKTIKFGYKFLLEDKGTFELSFIYKNKTSKVKLTVTDDPQEATYTIVLYADEGTFANNQKHITITGKGGTKLKDATGYAQPTLIDSKFDKWVDSKGDEVAEDAPLSQDLLLTAKYKDDIQTIYDFETNNWATVIYLSQSVISFANAYVPGTPYEDETQAINAIKAWIPSAPLRKIIINKGGYKLEAKVRLIGVNHDVSSKSSKKLFTYEFAEAIDMSIFDLTSGKWNESNTNGCILRQYMNTAIYSFLPLNIQKAIIPANKTTDGSIGTEDYLFALSWNEVGSPSAPSGEGDTYTYYSSDAQNRRKKTFAQTGLGCSYWLRTKAKDSDSCPVCVDYENGILLQTTQANESLCVAPAFCI